MKKMIYAVKSGRKTGIFKKLPKYSVQTNQSNEKYCCFEYQSELEEESEDVPGSLRYAIKEAEEYLGDLVYLGENADYLADVSWVEDGFLPFGNGSEAENIDEEHDEWSADNRNTYDALMESWEAECRNIDVGLGKWSAGNRYIYDASMESWEMEYRNMDEGLDKWSVDDSSAYDALMGSWSAEKEYWKIAADMKKCVEIIRRGHSMTEKKNAADNLKRHLENCLVDENLSDLTDIYKGLRENNAIGYNPPAVARFVTRLANRYPKPKVI